MASKFSLIWLIWLFISFCVSEIIQKQQDAGAKKKNVLLITVDDLRAEIGTFLDEVKRPWLNPNIHTPSLDKLASRSAVFTRAYTQQALCNPSRTSFLTGRRPDTTEVWTNGAWFRATGNKNIVTLPQYFQQHNYNTVGMGKVFHLINGVDQDHKYSWSKFTRFRSDISDADETTPWRAVSEAEAKAKPLMDQLLTVDAKTELEENARIYNDTGKPFFIAVGYRRPHIPWVYPKRFEYLYPLYEIDPPVNMYSPYNMPREAWFKGTEVLNHLPEFYRENWSINSTFSDDLVKRLRRAYYSCVSYIDDEIGKLMDKVESLGILENTVVIFMGDHGWQIGEHGIWGKDTNFEEAVHAPLMISIPGLTENGVKRNELVEFVDLFPTLVEACELPKLPLCPKVNPKLTDECVEGISLVGLISDPECPWKQAVFSQHPYIPYKRKAPDAMGYSVRTENYRYTEWWAEDPPGNRTRISSMIFNMDEDPFELYNRIDDPNHGSAVLRCQQLLREGWRANVPSH